MGNQTSKWEDELLESISTVVDTGCCSLKQLKRILSLFIAFSQRNPGQSTFVALEMIGFLIFLATSATPIGAVSIMTSLHLFSYQPLWIGSYLMEAQAFILHSTLRGHILTHSSKVPDDQHRLFNQEILKPLLDITDKWSEVLVAMSIMVRSDEIPERHKATFLRLLEPVNSLMLYILSLTMSGDLFQILKPIEGIDSDLDITPELLVEMSLVNYDKIRNVGEILASLEGDLLLLTTNDSWQYYCNVLRLSDLLSDLRSSPFG